MSKPTIKPKTSSFNASIKLLSRKDYSIHKLTQALLAKGYSEHDISLTIEQCKKLNYVNDENYTQNKLRYYVTKGYGKYKIQAALEDDGISLNIIEQVINSANLDWIDLATLCLTKKFKYNIATFDDHKNYTRQANFLKSRGYSFEHIKQALAMRLDV